MEYVSEIVRHALHYGLHFVVPVVIAHIWYRKKWKQAVLILLSANLIDLDHLLARPIFDPNRCGVSFHILHSEYAIIVYLVLAIIPKTRLVGAGLLLHIFADFVDCVWMRV